MYDLIENPFYYPGMGDLLWADDAGTGQHAREHGNSQICCYVIRLHGVALWAQQMSMGLRLR